MATIFLSYSTKNRALATSVQERLVRERFEAPFIDHHPEDGLRAGVDWASDLRRRIAMCQALIFLCSPDSVASMWCFAEVQQAQALGKHVFVVDIVAGAVPFATLATLQRVSLVDDADTGWQRLLRGLELAGLRGMTDHAYRIGAPPWPGLGIYDESDAAVYQGREQETADALVTLAQMHTSGTPRAFVIAGASGTGKSSLLRAGITARMRKNDAHWRVLGPFRPRSNGVAALERALRDAEGAEQPPAGDGAVKVADRIRALATHVRGRAGHAERAVAIVVDQLDDVFVETIDAAFLQLLDEILGQDHTFVVASIQSPLLDRLQTAKAWNGRRVHILSLGRLAEERIADVIEKPASTAGLQWDPGMVGQLVTLARGNDALPLLSFALARMYGALVARNESRFRAADLEAAREGLDHYLASTADQLVNASTIGDRELASLFLRFVTLTSSKTGDVVTRIAVDRRAMSTKERSLIDSLVSNRILAPTDTDSNTVEVAHDSLFRTWPRFADWIERYRTFLAWRADLVMQRSAYATETGVLLSGRALSRAHSFRAEHDRFLDKADRDYIDRSVRARWIARAFLMLAMLAVASLVYWIAQKSLNRERTRELARQVETDALRAGDENRALEHSLRAARDARARDIDSGPEFSRALLLARVAARQNRDLPLAAIRVFGCKDGLLVVDRSSVALYPWSAIGGDATFRVENHRDIEQASCFGPKGPLVTADHDGKATVWMTQDQKPSTLPGSLWGKYGNAVLLESETPHILSVRALDTGVNAPLKTDLDLDSHDSLATDPAGRFVAVVQSLQADPIPNVHVIDSNDLKSDNHYPSMPGALSAGLYFSPRGGYLAATWANASAHVWSTATYAPTGATVGGNDICDVAFSEDEKTLITLSDDGRATAFRQLHDARDDAWLQIGAREVAKPSMCSVAVSPSSGEAYVPRGDSLRRWTVDPTWADAVRYIPEPTDPSQRLTARAIRLTDDGELSALARETRWRWRRDDSSGTSAPSKLFDDVMLQSFYASDLAAQLSTFHEPLLVLGDGSRVPLPHADLRVERAWISSAAKAAILVFHDDVSVFDFRGKPQLSFPAARGAALVHDDLELIVATPTAIERWTLGTPPRKVDTERSLPPGARLIAASNDGRSLAIVDASNLELVRVTADGRLSVSVIARDVDVAGAAFSTDGGRLATATAASVTYWDLTDEPAEVYTWTGRHAAWALSPNGRWLAIARAGAGIEVYDLSLDNLIRRACSEAVERKIWSSNEAPCVTSSTAPRRAPRAHFRRRPDGTRSGRPSPDRSRAPSGEVRRYRRAG